MVSRAVQVDPGFLLLGIGYTGTPHVRLLVGGWTTQLKNILAPRLIEIVTIIQAESIALNWVSSAEASSKSWYSNHSSFVIFWTTNSYIYIYQIHLHSLKWRRKGKHPWWITPKTLKETAISPLHLASVKLYRAKCVENTSALKASATISTDCLVTIGKNDTAISVCILTSFLEKWVSSCLPLWESLRGPVDF